MSATTPKRLRALRAIRALLLQINGSSEWHHTLAAANVRIGCMRFGREERPAVGINIERAAPREGGYPGHRQWDGTVYLDCFGTVDQSAPAESALELENDVLRALEARFRSGAQSAELSDEGGKIGGFIIIDTQPITTPDGTGIEGSTVQLLITTKQEY